MTLYITRPLLRDIDIADISYYSSKSMGTLERPLKTNTPQTYSNQIQART